MPSGDEVAELPTHNALAHPRKGGELTSSDMEPESRLSDLSAERRVEIVMLLLEQRQSQQGTPTDEGSGKARPGRQMLLHILEKLDPSAEMIQGFADELQVDLAPILERVGYSHGDESRCGGCPLGGQRVVPGQGPADADRWIVGQCPGGHEVAAGKPFVGRAGRRLDRALTAASVARSDLYITNAVLCHPPENKSTPPDDALEACHDRLIDEIRQKRPLRLLALGGKAALQVTGDDRPIRVLRRLAWLFADQTVVRVTWHPSPLALNRDVARSREFDEDISWLGEHDHGHRELLKCL
jgi:DNA polymerase